MEESKAQFLHSWFEQIESQVQFGDSKASLLIAGDAILLAISGGLIKMVSGCQGNDFTVSCMVLSITLGLAVIAAALLVLSLVCALLAARPAKIHKDPPPELFLLSYIADMKRAEFGKAYRDASLDNLVEEALSAIYGKAVYATQKFRWLKHAVDATLLSLGFMVATLLVAIAIRVSG